MSGDIVYSCNGIEIRQQGERYFVRYDAGAHMVVLREDEITRAEAAQAMSSGDGATEVLFALQCRLLSLGIDPYSANV